MDAAIGRGLKVAAVICFVLAMFGVPLAPLVMIALGLGLSTAAEVL
jgi:hypothetical protein